MKKSYASNTCTINISYQYGFESALSLTDRPDAPRFPVVENIRDDSVVLSWKPPLNDGGSFITEYVIEKCEPPATNWIRVCSTR